MVIKVIIIRVISIIISTRVLRVVGQGINY